MGLTDIKHAIADKTKTEVASILDAAAAEAASIISQAQARVNEIREAHRQETARLLEAQERKERAAAAFQAKTKLLEAKRAAIDDVFSTAAKTLASASGKERTAILDSLAGQASKTIDVAKVYCSQNDVAALKKRFPQATVVTQEGISGGLIAENKDGTVRTDYTYETLLETVKDRIAPSLRDELFS